MSEENMEKQEEKCSCSCECKCPMMSEDFRKFLIVLTGTFLGAFFALSMFYGLNKPLVPTPTCTVRYGYDHFEHRMGPGMHHFDDEAFEHGKPAKPMHKRAPEHK